MPNDIDQAAHTDAVSHAALHELIALADLPPAMAAHARIVGGDSVKGLRFADLLPVFLADDRTHGIVLVGEVGGSEEEECADALVRLGVCKPLYALIAGREAKEGVSMGHAGALVFGEAGSFASKTRRLKAAGARVFSSIEALVQACVQDFAALRS